MDTGLVSFLFDFTENSIIFEGNSPEKVISVKFINIIRIKFKSTMIGLQREVSSVTINCRE